VVPNAILMYELTSIRAKSAYRRLRPHFPASTAAKRHHGRMAYEPGYTAAQKIPGIGPTLAAVLVAEIGDATRFATAGKRTCWAGLTPKHHASDTHVHRGRMTKQGPRLVRWAPGT